MITLFLVLSTSPWAFSQIYGPAQVQYPPQQQPHQQQSRLAQQGVINSVPQQNQNGIHYGNAPVRPNLQGNAPQSQQFAQQQQAVQKFPTNGQNGFPQRSHDFGYKQPLLRPSQIMYDRSNGASALQGVGSLSTSPGIFQNPTRQSSRLSPSALLTLTLTSYINENKAMKDSKTCYCSREECTILENVLHPCYFTFTAVITPAGGEPAQYISKQFVIINETGQPQIGQGDWSAPVTLQLTSKPVNIDIFVNNLGPVVQGRTVVYLNEFWLVDTFTLDLSDYVPTVANQQPQPVVKRLTGSVVRSSLEVSYSVQCQAGFMGADCDLQCKPTNSAPARAICTSRLTNVSSVCGFDSTRTLVQNCTVCGLGLQNEECAELAGLVQRELGVSKAYKVWTIVLGVLAGLLFLLLLVLLALYVLALRRGKNRTELRERQRIYQQQRHADRPLVSQPMLVDSWNKPRETPVFQRHPLADQDSIQSDAVHGTPIVNYSQPPRREAQV